MKLRITFLLLIYLTVFSGKAQTVTDSLERALPSSKDTFRINLLNDLSFRFCESDSKKSISYAREAAKLSDQFHFPIGKAKAFNSIGIAYDIIGNYDSALHYYQASLAISKKENNKKQIANTLNNIGLVEWNKGEYGHALNNYLSSLKLFEEINSKKGQANTLSNIGLIYTDLKNFQEALRYHQQALKIREELKDDYGIGVSLTNIGRSYSDLKDTKTALEYSLRAIIVKEKTEDLYGLAISYNNTGIIYYEMNDLDKSMTYHLKALPIRIELDDQYGLITTYNNISAIYNDKKEYQNALSYSLKSLSLAEELKSGSKLRKVYKDVSHGYKELKDYEKALYYHEKYSILNDSIFSEESARQIVEMQAKYESEKKDLILSKQTLELNKNQLEIKNQKMQRNILIGSFLLLILLTYLFYNRYKLKQKEERQRDLIHQQESRSRAIIEAEEKERIRIAQELHDGIGQQLSAVKLNMSSLQSSLGNSNAEHQLLLQNAIEIIDESVNEVRTVSHNMMPNALIKSGLGIAVREFLNRISSTDKLKIELEINGLNERLESTTETILFRVLQEIVNNMIKHSEASVVNIQLIRYGDELTMMIEDNGVGFDPDNIKSDGIGLKNIRSRIEYLNGTVHFDSRPGKGTTISIEVPLNK